MSAYRSALLCALAIAITLSAAFAEPPKFRIDRDISGKPVALVAENSARVRGAPALSAAEAEASAKSFVESQRGALEIPADATLRVIQTNQDAIGHTRVRISQEHKGVPVWGGEVIVNLDASGAPVYTSANIARALPKSVKASARHSAAKTAALRAAGAEVGGRTLKASNPVLYIVPAGALYQRNSGEDKLAWLVVVDEGKEIGFSKSYFVDASSGQVLTSFDNHYHRDLRSYDCAKQVGDTACYVDSMGISPYVHGRSDAEPVRGPHNNTALPQYMSTDVDEAWDLGAAMHDWVMASFGLNGANNLGGLRKNSGERTQTRYYVHAEGWDQNQASYCPGGASLSSNYSVFMCHGEVFEDVVGHEYGHGLSNWAFLSGGGSPLGVDTNSPHAMALAESFSDVMGEVFQWDQTGQTEWLYGDGRVEGNKRDLVSPNSSLDYLGRAHAQRFYDPFFNCDSSTGGGGFYLNSTVFSHAMYLSAVGGQFNGCDVEPQGVEFVKQVFFRAWRTYFTRTQDFAGAFNKLLQACSDLYSPTQCAELEKALRAVESDQLGRCVDPEGIAGEDAPACAVNHVGSLSSVRPNWIPTSLYAPGEQIWAKGINGTPNRDIKIFLVPHVEDRGVWSTLEPIAELDAATDNEGRFTVFLAQAPADGFYDIVAGNVDGSYQPWADSVTTLEVRTPVEGDGLCYQGENYIFSEDCNESPTDCACQAGYQCRNYGGSPPLYQCWRRSGGGCFLAGTKVLMSDGSTKAIEDIKEGDKVRSIDPKSGQFTSGTVVALRRAETEEYVVLNGKTKVTPNHRFYVPAPSEMTLMSVGYSPGDSRRNGVLPAEKRAGGEWVEIGKLAPGTMLLGDDGRLVEIKTLERVQEESNVYNFEVSPHRNYIANGVVVHNRKKLPYLIAVEEGGLPEYWY